MERWGRHIAGLENYLYVAAGAVEILRSDLKIGTYPRVVKACLLVNCGHLKGSVGFTDTVPMNHRHNN